MGFPTIIKLTKSDFEGISTWPHPDTSDIMNAVVNPPKVLPLPEIANSIKTTKFIPIPLFLVPMFLNQKRGLTTVAAFQEFYDFYEKASSDMQINTQYIFHFLWAATGYDATNEQDKVPTSQLAVSMEEVALDSIITQWASSQFGGIKHMQPSKKQPKIGQPRRRIFLFIVIKKKGN